MPTYKGKTMWGHSEKAASYKPNRDTSEEIKYLRPLILNFQPPELWKNKFILFNPPRLVFYYCSPSKLIHEIIFPSMLSQRLRHGMPLNLLREFLIPGSQNRTDREIWLWLPFGCYDHGKARDEAVFPSNLYLADWGACIEWKHLLKSKKGISEMEFPSWRIRDCCCFTLPSFIELANVWDLIKNLSKEDTIKRTSVQKVSTK